MIGALLTVLTMVRGADCAAMQWAMQSSYPIAITHTSTEGPDGFGGCVLVWRESQPDMEAACAALNVEVVNPPHCVSVHAVAHE